MKNVCLTVVGCATATATATVAVVLLRCQVSEVTAAAAVVSSLRDFMAV